MNNYLYTNGAVRCAFPQTDYVDDEFERLLDEFIFGKDSDDDTETNATDTEDDTEQEEELDFGDYEIEDETYYDDDDSVTAEEADAPIADYDYGLRNNAPQEPTAKERLGEMIGLERVKRELDDASTLSQFHMLRDDVDLHDTMDHRNHMIFLGNPGTGKTTVAKLIGEMYKNMRILSEGHTIEVDRTKLMGEFIGHTEQKMREVIKDARGGVLFIDEAYTLIYGDGDDRDFGKEVLNALLPVLAEPDPDMIVIMAGYADKMERLLKSNPGLHDRFPIHIHFDDYTEDELMLMARKLCENYSYKLSDEADSRLRALIDKAVAMKDEHFGNGRWVHNVIEHQVVRNMARRVCKQVNDSMDRGEDRSRDVNLLTTIEAEDIRNSEAEALCTLHKSKKKQEARRIGFVR